MLGSNNCSVSADGLHAGVQVCPQDSARYLKILPQPHFPLEQGLRVSWRWELPWLGSSLSVCVAVGMSRTPCTSAASRVPGVRHSFRNPPKIPAPTAFPSNRFGLPPAAGVHPHLGPLEKMKMVPDPFQQMSWKTRVVLRECGVRSDKNQADDGVFWEPQTVEIMTLGIGFVPSVAARLLVFPKIVCCFQDYHTVKGAEGEMGKVTLKIHKTCCHSQD